MEHSEMMEEEYKKATNALDNATKEIEEIKKQLKTRGISVETRKEMKQRLNVCQNIIIIKTDQLEIIGKTELNKNSDKQKN